MKKIILTLLQIILTIGVVNGRDAFQQNFSDSTLRMDYIFGGTNRSGMQALLSRQSKYAGWAGRRQHLDRLPYKALGVISMIDPLTGDTLYRHSFSTLFQEWISTPEADSIAKSFEGSFLLPLPQREMEINVKISNDRRIPIINVSHTYNPGDELVRVAKTGLINYEYIHKGGEPAECIDIAILAEGYTKDEMSLFKEDANKIAEEILRYEPYASNRDKFNFVIVYSESEESGVSIPAKGEWRKTPFNAHFSTFHLPRYMTTPSVHKVHDSLAGIPYEHVMILVNTDQYGGGGIYNNYLITSAHNKFVLPVTVHEFGHSFGGLADEYFYASEENEHYPLDIEPWEPNITTMVDFASKWEDMISDDKPINDTIHPGLFEGGGYRVKGIFRPFDTCRMRDNYHPDFCAVCRRALERLIKFYTHSEE